MKFTLRPLHYIIFHPERRPYRADGAQHLDGRIRGWRGILWADRIPVRSEANEAPFIWANEWLYSYCHATQIKRVDRQDASPIVGRGSLLFFCSTPIARHTGNLAVDTVFEVARRIEWPREGIEPPAHFCPQTPEYQRHLKHGIRQPGRKGHAGRFTYVAKMRGHSFLPRDNLERPFVIQSKRLPSALRDRMRDAVPERQMTKPVELTEHEAARILGVLQAAPTKVTFVATREKQRRADLKQRNGV